VQRIRLNSITHLFDGRTTVDAQVPRIVRIDEGVVGMEVGINGGRKFGAHAEWI
jgi:hypothetical protein